MPRTLKVKVKPGSRVDELVQLDDGTWQARVKAPPVDGKANAAVAGLIAAHFGLRKPQVTLKSGGASRLKIFQLED